MRLRISFACSRGMRKYGRTDSSSNLRFNPFLAAAAKVSGGRQCLDNHSSQSTANACQQGLYPLWSFSRSLPRWCQPDRRRDLISWHGPRPSGANNRRASRSASSCRRRVEESRDLPGYGLLRKTLLPRNGQRESHRADPRQADLKDWQNSTAGCLAAARWTFCTAQRPEFWGWASSSARTHGRRNWPPRWG